MILIYNNEFIAGVCKDKETLESWEKVHPIPSNMNVETKKLNYPFYVMEESDSRRLRKYTFLQSQQEVDFFKSTHKQWTLYTFTKDWQGTSTFEDYMGVLDHDHSNED